MKTHLFYTLFFFTLLGYSQDFNKDLDAISELEAKSALSLLTNKVNLNTGNYDLKYHRLEFNVDPSQAFISGEVTSYFIAKENMNEMTFDLSNNMLVSQVSQRGNLLPFVQNTNDELVITLPQIQNQGVLDSLTVSYSGNPISSGFGSFEQSTHNSAPIIWTLSEPYGAKGWWPCKQDLNDKIDSIDVFITSPRFNAFTDENIAVSNGLEQSQVIQGASKTTHFKHQYPIPAYLIAMAVTNYAVYSHLVANNGNPFDVINYVYPENLASAQSSTPVTVNLINLYANLFEPYPYADEKYGHAQFGWGGGMEHTTVSFMGGFSRGLIAHELAHQWFGDKVTCGSWKDIWLNEGFATYLSGMVIENFDGNTPFRIWKQDRTASITSATDGAVYLTDQDTTNVNRIFSTRLSYNKGAMVLHMLRKKLGDVTFFQGLKNYLAHPDLSYGYAKTEDLIAIMEAESGLDLTEFFNDWIYNQGYPSYSISWNQPNSNSINVQIAQTQSHPSVSFFEAPVPLRIYGTQGEILDLVLDNTINLEEFETVINFTVQAVSFDPEADLISKNNNVILGTNDFQFAPHLVIYPNPTSEVLHIQNSENITFSEIQIFNALGQKVYQNVFSKTVDISSLTSGVLFVRLKSKQGIVTKLVIKK
ncbi:MAG: peptidase M1 [Bacteroidetes bacterium HGW-Bacteroidetes-2]|jgi:aminopeptidase N|nr:MAG: peptidase M1 [Bacteroidetes bacterium HGW-Bacteroidetes-2]